MTDRLGQGAVSEPEPTDEELRRDKLQADFERAQEAEAEAERREEFTRLIREKIEPILRDATDEVTARRWVNRIWREVLR